MALAIIYKATELYMLQDTSEDHKETWLFLERRIMDALQVYSIISNSESSSDVLKLIGETGTAVFVTVNIFFYFCLFCTIECENIKHFKCPKLNNF